MDESSSDFRDILLELIESSPEPVDHPSADRWIAYQRGELAGDEEALLQEHLARCRDCFELAAAAAAFAQPDAEPAAGHEAAAAVPPPRRFRRRRPAEYALAASLAAVVGLTSWGLHLRSVVEAQRAPRPNAEIFDLNAGDRDPGRRELIMPAGARMLVFHPDEELPAYRLAIRDAATGRELQSHELRLDQDRALTLYLPDGLPPGRYRLELADGRTGKLVERDLVRVTEPDRGD